MASSSVSLSSDSAGRKSSKTCDICDEKPSKYSCPRCDVFYCSLDCYKSQKHAQCSENFYRDCVTQELAGHHADGKSRDKMVNILKRLNDTDMNSDNEDSQDSQNSDDEDYHDLQERLKGVDIDDANAVWNVLNQDERNEFEALVNEGEVSSIIPLWEPWWMYSKEEIKVQDLSVEDNSEAEHLTKCPQLVNVPEYRLLNESHPSPYTPYNIANVLATYTAVIRYFNGELEDIEGATYITMVSGNLSSDTEFVDYDTAMKSVEQFSQNHSDLLPMDQGTINLMILDTSKILQGPSKDNKFYYVKAALSHIYKIFERAHVELKNDSKRGRDRSGFFARFQEHGPEYLPELHLSKLEANMLKIQCHLAYVNEFACEQ